jgi:hypothetical protein
MYERITKLLEAELLRANGEEQYSYTEEQKDIFSLSPSAPRIRPETSHSDTSLLEPIPNQVEKTLDLHIKTSFF